jgi:uncharacterized Zn-finger protein
LYARVYQKSGGRLALLKPAIALAIGLAMLVVGSIIAQFTQIGIVGELSGLLVVASFVVLAVAAPSYLATRRAAAKALRAQQALDLSLKESRQKMVMAEKVVTTTCPYCGAPLDVADIQDNDIVVCRYCGTSVKFKG